jgi:rhodanese-related sulfurtransferase
MSKLLLIATLIFGSAAFAGTKKSADTHAKDALKLIHVADLEQMMKSHVFIFDANGDDTRKESGMIPGAKPLTSSSQYDVAKTLPSDKAANLVFYCANEQCMASHDAAKRAMKAGYNNVSVMADGIQGWVKAGKPTQKPQS